MNIIAIRFDDGGFYGRNPTITFMELDDISLEQFKEEMLEESKTGTQIILYRLEDHVVNNTFFRGMVEGHWVREYGNQPFEIVTYEYDPDMEEEGDDNG